MAFVVLVVASGARCGLDSAGLSSRDGGAKPIDSGDAGNVDGAAGTTGRGDTIGSGGSASTGGMPGTGGAPGSGGTMSRDAGGDGAVGSGGATTGTGARTGSGGGTTTGSGGGPSGTGGRNGTGGVTGSGGRAGTGGSGSGGLGSGGRTGSGGVMATGGRGGTGAGGRGGSGGGGGTGGAGGRGGNAGTGGRGQGGAAGTCGGIGPSGNGTLRLDSYGIEDGTFAAEHTCAGRNSSPALMWNAGPTGTKAYAVILQDLTTCGLMWIAWDIPETELEADLPAGQFAQVEQWEANPEDPKHPGYAGPCPPGGQTHTYRFTVLAQDVNELPMINYGGTTTGQQIVNAILQHDLAFGTLTATSNARAP